MGKDDRFFPAAFQSRVARERLGKAVDEIPGGHLVALSRPRELVQLLLGYTSCSPRPEVRESGEAARDEDGRDDGLPGS